MRQFLPLSLKNLN